MCAFIAILAMCVLYLSVYGPRRHGIQVVGLSAPRKECEEGNEEIGMNYTRANEAPPMPHVIKLDFDASPFIFHFLDGHINYLKN